jgi:internalin A
VSSAGLIPLSNLQELIDLDLSGTKIDNQITAVLATLPLVRLNCSRTAISDVGLPQLAKISTLEDLTLSFNRGVTGVGFRVFKGAKLKKLDIGVTSFGVEGLKVLRGMQTLEELSVYETGIFQRTDALIFGTLPKLKKLNIGKNAITDDGLTGRQSLFKGCRNLEHLNLSTIPTVTSAGLAGLITLKNLRYLDCSQTGVEAQGATALKQKIPELTVRIGSGEEI